MNYNEACALELKRLRAEAEEAHNSAERIVYEIHKSYWELVDHWGKHRANELLREFIRRQEDYLAQDRIAALFDLDDILKMCEEKIEAGEATGWMKSFYWSHKKKGA